MNIIAILVIVVIAGVWIITGCTIGLSIRSFTWKSCLTFFAGTCLIIGIIGFAGSALSAAGGLSWLPDTFEWPIGVARNVLVTPDGTHIVPHTPTGRIQVYDKDLNFQRGWTIDAGGGVFTLVPAGENDFYVYIARGDKIYQYDVYGNLLSSDTYPGEEYSQMRGRGKTVAIPTPFYLLAFVHPIISWIVILVGAVLTNYLAKSHKETGKDNTPSDGTVISGEKVTNVASSDNQIKKPTVKWKIRWGLALFMILLVSAALSLAAAWQISKVTDDLVESIKFGGCIFVVILCILLFWLGSKVVKKTVVQKGETKAADES